MLTLESAIFRHPSVLSSDTTVLSAVDQMSGSKDSSPSNCVVVLDADQVLGVFTERDVVRLVSQQQPIHRLTLREVLTQPPVILPESALEDLAAAINLLEHQHLEHQHITHLPIVNEHQQLTGLVNYDDLKKLQAEPNQVINHSQSISETRHAAFVAASPVGILHANPEGICTYANDHYCEIIGVDPATLKGQPWHHGYSPEDLEQIVQEFEQSLHENRPMRVEYRVQRPDGTERWVFGQSVADRDATGHIIGYVGTITDITDRKRTEFLLASQNVILEQIAKANPIREILANLLQTIETYIPIASCSIMLCQDGWLCNTIAPSLPQEYLASIAQIPIGEGVGSCGTAVYRREVVIVENIEQDPLWQDYKHLALPYGLRASWSVPIFGSDQKLLGVFGVYFPQPQRPSLSDIETVRKAANLAGIAIERDRSAQALQQLNQELESRIQQRTQDLQEREQFLQVVLDTFPLSIFWKDRNSVYLGCNQQFLRDANKATITDVIGKTDYEMPWGQTEAELYRQDDLKVITTETAKLGIVEPQYQADGKQMWLETNKMPLRNLQGEVIGILGTYQDITDRKNIENQLIIQQNHLSALLDNLPHIAWIKDDQSRFIAVNQPFAQACGSTVEALVGKTDYDIWPAALAQAYQDDDLQVLKSGQRKVVEERIALADGSMTWSETTKTPFRDANGNLAGTVGIAANITARKTAEIDLQNSQAQFRRLTENLPGMIYQFILQVDGQSRFSYVSPQSADIYEVAAELIMQDPANIWERIHPDDVLTLQAKILESAQDLSPFVFEHRLLTPSGPKFVNAISRPYRQNDGEIVWDGVVVDITARKAAEIKLQQTNAELIRATRLKDEFLANMSHELRTPLNAILGMTEGLTEEVFGNVNDRQLKALETIDRSGSHLLELINDILDVAKIESGHLELDCQPTSVALICQSSLTFIKQQAQAKSITLKTDLPPDLPNLMVEERRIRQVVINLLNNAVKFTSEGGKITLAVKNTQSGFLVISVTDTGIGISPTHIKKLFQPFIQIDSALNRKYEGTGLGLTLVKRIVELHGGSVGLTSEVGVGSCFSISLPCVDATVQRLRLEPTTSVEPLASEAFAAPLPLILLAEDNEANISTIYSYLEAKGYRLVVAHDGQEAINLVQSAHPDLVLMDIQMPGMDGLEAMQIIRRDPQFAELPIIALTALAMTGDREKCIAAGANDYISKPIKLKNLAQSIQLALAHRSANSQLLTR